MQSNQTLLKSARGFTLVEISIVIVLIGLILAGVTAGNSLVRSARIRAALQESDSYITAVQTFYLQYNALPGDMGNASSYWPTAANGNGDKLIGKELISEPESYAAFKQLALNGLIPGSYTGSGGLIPTIGVMYLNPHMVPIALVISRVILRLAREILFL